MAALHQNVSEKEIEVALYSVAQLVSTYGDKYWPIFERLEKELDKLRAKSMRLAQVLQEMDQDIK